MPVDIDHLRGWIGRAEVRSDQFHATPAAALSATLDRDDPTPRVDDPLPPLWHWLYFLPLHRHSEIGADGHAARGAFLPPVPLPRRMFAGGRLRFHSPLRIGEAVSRTSRIVEVSHKTGRSGELVFVMMRHEYNGPAGLAMSEEHDIVYRDAPRPDAPQAKPTPAPADCDWQRVVKADDVLLFRYSALTFNGHRIHYDRRYVTEIEGYPGLVVHGPLIATLLLDLLRRKLPQARVKSFEFRAVKPLFDIAPFSVCGKPQPDGRTLKLWANDENGWLAMDATAVLE